jgi:hypothetical protein
MRTDPSLLSLARLTRAFLLRNPHHPNQEAPPDKPLLIPQVLCPLKFREQASSNIRAIDQHGSETKKDPDTGEEITGGEGNDLFHGVTSVVWGAEHVTLTQAVGYNCSKEWSLLSNVAAMMSLVPPRTNVGVAYVLRMVSN